jgi:sugar phosphate isomerase/epimerase
MELKLVRHLWGVNDTWEVAFPKIKAEGFTAIESPMPGDAEAGRFKDLLKRHGFDYVAMAFTGGASVGEHVKSFEDQLKRAGSFGATQLTCHSAVDSLSPADADAYFSQVLKIEKDHGLTVAHETHRGRLLFNPWQTRDLLNEHADLKLCCDFSHWVCVAERLLGDCEDIIALAASRAAHLHSRVGYEEGPQVPDPRAPEYKNHLETHEKWWDVIWTSQKSRGMKVSTLTPEFGPPGYMHTLPFVNVPVANLWDICKWVADRQKARFVARVG